MSLSVLTVEEENLICIFDTTSRESLISGIFNALPDFDDPELLEIAENALRKVTAMTDVEFSGYPFHPAYHGDDDETEV